MTSSQPPRPPRNIPSFAQECLNALADAGLGRCVSLGGAFGLAHYYEYRTTHDLDAWWTSEATRDARARIVTVIEQALAPSGQTRTRPWGDIRVDSFDDLLASKMAALVNRGAPRDFLDIYTLCSAGQTSIAACWRLWQERQRLSGEDDDLRRATLAVRANLARIEAARPLAGQPNSAADERSMTVRAWFEQEFLHGLD